MGTGKICTKRHFCTKTICHKGTLLHKDTFTQVTILHEIKKKTIKVEIKLPARLKVKDNSDSKKNSKIKIKKK